MGFSEMSTLVNLVASYRCGRGVYWLCPNYLAWKIKPPAESRTAFSRFWSEVLPEMVGCGGHRAGDLKHAKQTKLASPADLKATDLLRESRRPLRAKIVAGSVRPGLVRFVGGCLTVFSAALAGPMRARVRPDGKWLAIEDVNEAPYRVDRALATLKLEGWFDRLAGVLVGDFHTGPDLQ
ncbi:MAG: hypothetical protein HZB38_08355, partial [Planctomycetes bacterium]|nr:hypothetical protein [Planctomycetota bacterium]